MQTGRILIVDDEAAARAVATAMLEKQGHHCHTVADPKQALAACAQHGPFDVVITNLLFADLAGLELADAIQKQYPQMPVVGITAQKDLAIAMTALRRGAFDYLVRPVGREQLITVVDRALHHSRNVQQNPGYFESLEQIVAQRTELLHQAMNDLERSYDITLEALGDALDLKDAETEGHSKRVTAYTIALARAMGHGHEDIRMIARGAYLHDIGKMAIPDAILLKPGPLNDAERAIMKEHCARGYQIVRKIPYLAEAAEIVYAHQERYDGKGYPRGLKGNEIPFGARVFAIADTLDAITSDRPYRKASSFQEARGEILKCAGTQFDPDMVEVFAALPEGLWQDLRDEINNHMHSFPSFAPLDSAVAETADAAAAKPSGQPSAQPQPQVAAQRPAAFDQVA